MNRTFQAQRAFCIGPYHAPAGFLYRAWCYGQILPASSWAPQYQMVDCWLLGLDVPPLGYEWIRYGPDMLLIDLHTGQIVQGAYSIFR